MATFSAGEVWSELDHNLILDGQGALKKAVNVQAVLSSVDNILGTRLTERVYLPNFGSNLWSMVFEPLDAHLTHILSQDIKDSIERWEDRATVVSVDVKQNADNHTALIIVHLQIRGNENIFTFEKTLNAG